MNAGTCVRIRLGSGRCSLSSRVRAARLSVVLHIVAGPCRVGHGVVLRGHAVRLPGGQHLRQRGANIGHAVGLKHRGVVGKSIKMNCPTRVSRLVGGAAR